MVNESKEFKLDINQARKKNEDGAKERKLDPMYKVEDFLIPTLDYKIKVRLFTPEGNNNGLIIYLHGGAFTLNSINTHEFLMRKIASKTKHKVLGVDFRLSPEYKFPIPLQDVISSIIWAYNNANLLGIDKNKIYLGGDSTGGTLTLASALYLRDMNMNILKKIFMIYPPLDNYNPGTKSYFEKGNFPVSREFLIWGWNNYFRTNENMDNEYIFPLQAKSYVGLPEILHMYGGLDALEDENKEFAVRLSEDKVPFISKCYEDQMHGFMMNENSETLYDALTKIDLLTK